MYDIEPIESILQQQKSELKSEIYQDLIRDYHKAKTDKDDDLRRKIGAILNNTYLKKLISTENFASENELKPH